jgi:uncharacterized protein YjbJ (UPF0337 family)
LFRILIGSWNPRIPNSFGGEIVRLEGGTMNWNHVEARWKQARRKAKEKWVRLTDQDLEIIQGRRERLERKIHERYGFAADHVHKEIEDWVRCQLAAAPRRPTRKTKLAIPRTRPRQNAGNGSVTALLVT